MHRCKSFVIWAKSNSATFLVLCLREKVVQLALIEVVYEPWASFRAHPFELGAACEQELGAALHHVQPYGSVRSLSLS